MFKAQVLRRSFSVFNRVPTARIVRSAARDGHERIVIQRVRIQRPFFSRQRLVGAVAITAAIYGLGQYLGLEVAIEEEEVEGKHEPGRWKKQVRKEDGSLGEVDDEEANQGEEEDEEEEEYDDAILFLPTGFSRKKPATFYKGSDPEWQEFVRVARDRKRVARIRQELVDTVRTSCSRSALVRNIGEVDHKKGQVWLEIQFPEGRPPEFERPGYELTENLEWRKATRPVEARHHFRLAHLLYPTAVASAIYADTKRKAERSWSDFTAYIGWAEKEEPPALQQMMQQLSNPSLPTKDAASPATTTSVTPLSTSGPAGTQQTAENPSPSSAGSAKDLGFLLPDPKALTLDLVKFRQDLQKSMKHVHAFPPGVFFLRGLVEVYGSKARVTFQVFASYDPKVGKYVMIHASPYSHAPHRQTPRGGY